MRILFGLTYYRPHVSGLTIYVQRLAEELARRGHRVTVLTSRYDPALPADEILNGVRVVRAPVLARISKGALMPTYGALAGELIAEHDVVAGNLPNTPLEALFLPLLARRAGRPVTMTYHCDVTLPPGLLNRVVDESVFASNLLAGSLADRIVAYTEDYARHSRVLRRFRRKIAVIPPPVAMPMPTPEQVDAFRERFDLRDACPVGFVARFATEKGVEYALRALPRLTAEIPNLKILFAGEYRRVIGEEAYWERLQPLLRQQAEHWLFTGLLDPADPAQLASFYAACAVTILPSVNMTESFGLVQVESMLCGTPVVAGNLPGVRQPVATTGMGRIVPIRDSQALAMAMLDVIKNRERYLRPREAISSVYSIERTADGYEQLFQKLTAGRNGASPGSRDVSRGGMRIDAGRSIPVRPARRDYLAEHLEDVPAFRALLRGVECRLFEQAGAIEPPVLDLGCGDGHFAQMAFREPLLTGVDRDLPSLREAKGRGVYRCPVAADATALPFGDSSFASIVANCSIEHVPDVEAVMREAARVLRPGGRFLFGVPSHKFGEFLLGSTLLAKLGLRGMGRGYGDWFNEHSQHYTTDSPEQWLERLDRHGFDAEHWEYYVSPAGHRAFDLAHYLGVPRLISRKLTGKWTAFRNPPANALFAAWLRPYYEEGPPDVGAYIFFHARKRDGRA